MGRSYLGSRENISTGQIMLFCSYGEMFSRLSGELCSYGIKIISVTEISPVGKLFISYERKVTFHTIFVRRRDLACKLVEMFSR